MTRTLAIACALAATMAAAAATAEPANSATTAKTPRIPTLLDDAQQVGYRAIFGAIRDGRWTDAQLQLDALKPGPLHAIARAELYTAKGSPRVDLDKLLAVLNEAPELPQAEQLARLAKSRGASELPPLPETQTLIWRDGAPRRARAKSVKSDEIAATLAVQMQPYVKADQGAPAQALLESTSGLTPEAQTEWQQRVAWMYFLGGDDTNARAMAAKAAVGSGEWAIQGRWAGALSAWRQGDCAAAENGFEGVAARAPDVDLRAAALYWASRADMVCGRPDKIEGRLKAAAQFGESFYGQLARQALGLKTQAQPGGQLVATDWAALDRRPNIRVAAALAEIGESELADTVIRQQARIGAPAEFRSLVRLAESLDLPATTVWLAHNCPAGVTATAEARYPTPNWTPDSGWRVDKALVYAHTLQESGFRNKVVSPAGAYGLMQIMPAAATDFARERGVSIDKSALTKPSTNMDVGQRHLERLRDMAGITGGLLPKVIAAYNAGPKPVGEWNSIVHDGGDPLLYIESIPYWETRGYVTTVLRNYWMYEGQAGKARSPSRTALAQGMWPRFPGLPGAAAVRMNAKPNPRATADATTAIAVQAAVSPQSTTVTRAD
ncbi:lytic transglycosylase domain-containing protein [Sphingomonas carotinifaciens]|uniref:Soluble lytic murein transglycosylase n=2 Tax=Sphingomonas TaxID=13687 RepID=A0A1G7ENC0_9SPHN|nr:lytic transglycosylase domain-containing protein [Sphingomonas carotinifaciens]MBB4085687.1 soluble lytic murein transglycosylase-like protein [Sphingomonas carotinifaciens]SDE65151.1 Soluble lytic murein transglycosylase [Sphingomonas carotinifaciens]